MLAEWSTRLIHRWRLGRCDSPKTYHPYRAGQMESPNMTLYRSVAARRLLMAVLVSSLPIAPCHALAQPTLLGAVTPLDFFGAPAGVVSPDGRRVVFSEWEGERLRRLYVLDLESTKADKDRAPRLLTPGSGGRSAPDWSPDGATLVYADDAPGRRGLWLADVVSGRERRLLRADSTSAPQPMQPRWSADGRRVWFAARAKGGVELWSVSADGSAARREAVDGGAWPAPSPDGASVAVIASQGGVSLLRLHEPATGRTRDLTGPMRFGRFGGPVWSRDGRAIYVSAAAARDSTLGLWSVDVTTGRAEHLTSPPGAGDVLRPSVTASGELVAAVTAGGPRVAVVPATGGDPITLGEPDTPPAFLPAFLPDGRSVAATAGSWGRLTFPARLDIARFQIPSRAIVSGASDRGRPSIVLAEDDEDYGAEWSRDGRWIAFHSHRGNTDDIYARRAEGGPVVTLSTLGAGRETGAPSWSPDGRRIVFPTFFPDAATRRSTLVEIVFDPDAGKALGVPRRIALTGFDGDAIGARYSPDGTRIAFTGRLPNGTAGVWVVPAAGGAPRALYTSRSDEGYSPPEWTPDGRALLFAKNDTPRTPFRVWRAPLEGGAPFALTPPAVSALQPRLSPDGRTLAVTITDTRVEYWRIARP